MSYATAGDWLALGDAPEDETEQERWLRRASEDIDTLTWGRIRGIGWENLTDFQRETVTAVCCALAGWELENAALLESPMNSYSINGVSAAFGQSAGVAAENGVLLPRRLYRLLEQTGLCWRGLP